MINESQIWIFQEGSKPITAGQKVAVQAYRFALSSVGGGIRSLLVLEMWKLLFITLVLANRVRENSSHRRDTPVRTVTSTRSQI